MVVPGAAAAADTVGGDEAWGVMGGVDAGSAVTLCLVQVSLVDSCGADTDLLMLERRRAVMRLCLFGDEEE